MSKRTQVNKIIRNTASSKKRSSTPLLIGLVVLAVLGVVAVFLALQPQGKTATLPAEISTSEALSMREAGALVLDVREPDEWAQGHIPGATLIPLGELSGRTTELPKDQEIVVVCRSGNRSATGRDILKQAGFNLVTSMAGGMNDWSAAGYPTENGQ